MKFALMLAPPPLISPRTGLADWSLNAAMQRHVAEVLRYTGGDQRWAADELGVDESTVYRWLRRWAAGETANLNLARRTA